MGKTVICIIMRWLGQLIQGLHISVSHLDLFVKVLWDPVHLQDSLNHPSTTNLELYNKYHH